MAGDTKNRAFERTWLGVGFGLLLLPVNVLGFFVSDLACASENVKVPGACVAFREPPYFWIVLIGSVVLVAVVAAVLPTRRSRTALSIVAASIWTTCGVVLLTLTGTFD